MFQRKYRLPPTVIFTTKNILYSSLFVLKIKENGEIYNRYGFIVGKRIDKRATKRNEVNRRFRAILEELEKEEKIVKGKDFLFILKKEVLHETEEEIREEVMEILKKRGLLRVHSS